MSIDLTTQNDVWVFLPSRFEFHSHIDVIFRKAFERGANETSYIGPCIKFENMEPKKAKEIVSQILNDLRIK